MRVVALPKGQDPADAPEGFEDRLATAESYVVFHVRLVLDRTPDRQDAFVLAREVLYGVEDSPERKEALRLLADRLDLPRATLEGLRPKHGAQAASVPQELSPAMLEKGEQLERRVLAACVAEPALVTLLAELPADHFDSELHRRFRAFLIEGGEEDEQLTTLRAELDARAAREAIDERTGKELLLNLRARRLRRELAGAELERVKELQAALAKLAEAAHEIH